MKVFHNYSARPFSFIHRIIITFIFMFVLTIILVIHLYKLQIIHFHIYSTKSNKNRIKIIPIPPNRGIIYDRNKIALALNRITYQLEIIPEKVNNLDQTIYELQSLLELSNENIKTFKKKIKNFSKSSSLTLKIDLTEEQLARFSINQFRFSGVRTKKYYRRYYPYGSICTHVIGYVSKINKKDIQELRMKGILNDYKVTSNIGKLGIERYYETILHGKPGYKAVEVNNKGKIIRKLHQKLPISGKDIILTLDLNLQKYIMQLLQDSRSSAIVIDPRDGSIQSLTSNPSYDPNLFVDGISNKEYHLLLNDRNKPLINRATQGVYPPASTVKPYISVSALILGTINKDFLFFDPGWWKLPGSEKRFRDWKRWGHGELNITKALEESSDTFFYQIAYQMGIDNLSKWMNKFGYGRYTGIDLFEELKGIMPTREWKHKKFKTPWYHGDTISVGIGQGYWTATPVQMSKALITLINNGLVRIPHLLNYILSENHMIQYNQIINEQIGDPKSNIWNLAKDGMYGAANRPNGTVKKFFQNTTYTVAAKSGTAQLYNLKYNEFYDSKKISENLKDHKLMTAYAPYENPTVAIIIILENGMGKESIGIITKKIFDYIFLK